MILMNHIFNALKIDFFNRLLAAEASAEQGGVVLDPNEWFESV